jgi:DNA-binding NtrC family response regulator
MALANETVAQMLDSDNGDLREALDRFRSGLEADTVAVLVLEETAAATVRSLAGDAAVLNERQIARSLSRMKWSSPEGFAGLYRANPSSMIVVAHHAGPRTHHVLAVCRGHLDEDLVPVCELVLRAALHAAPIATVDAAVGADPAPLVFPDNHVPGLSQASQRMYEQIAALRNGTGPILIVGETGVGKEHVVRILHASSDRADGPLRVLNCAAIPAELLEAELFGIEAGVATGVDRRKGAFREADRGTLFFDEIGAMPLPLQAKLLRALQEDEVHPIGAQRPVPVDVRIVAATNTDLTAAIKNQTFRSDLYYRIAGSEIAVAPLRKRREDIPALVSFFLERCATESTKRIRGLSVGTLTQLQNAAWPGNIRQLEHEIRRLVSICSDGATIESSMISPEIIAAGSLDDEIADDDLTLKRHVDALERRLIRRAVDQAGGNLAQAARLLGLSRNGLVMKMGRLGRTRA